MQEYGIRTSRPVRLAAQEKARRRRNLERIRRVAASLAPTPTAYDDGQARW